MGHSSVYSLIELQIISLQRGKYHFGSRLPPCSSFRPSLPHPLTLLPTSCPGSHVSSLIPHLSLSHTLALLDHAMRQLLKALFRAFVPSVLQLHHTFLQLTIKTFQGAVL